MVPNRYLMAFAVTLSQFIRDFCGLGVENEVCIVSKDGSPGGGRYKLSYKTSMGRLHDAASIASLALSKGARLICFTQSRKGIQE